MDSAGLLSTVAATYASLETVAVELLITNESNDGERINRSEQRAKGWFATPDKVRIERGGQRGSVIVTNGVDLHHWFGRQERYSRTLWHSRPP
jgi:hypothetical protein